MSSCSVKSALLETLPSILYRCKWPLYQEKFGLPFTKGTMQNLDSRNEGPKSFKCGGKVFYFREDYLKWLEAKVHACRN